MIQQRPSFAQCSSSIEPQNLTSVLEFHLVTLSEDPELQPVLSGLFLTMFLVAVLGNLLIVLAVGSDPRLHTPMYFFLCNLSLADIGFISTTVPKMIVDLQTHSGAISYAGCLAQMSFFILFGNMDNMLLTAMAYDRFVAICHPLRYSVIMSPHLCVFLVLVSFFITLLDLLLHNLIVLYFIYFKDVKVANFFCEPSQLLSLVCAGTSANKTIVYFIGAVLRVFPVWGILFSYYKIVSSILRSPASGRSYKAFSTCGSHLAVVCLFYGTGLVVYLGSAVSHSPRNMAVSSVMYTVVTPMLNPFIYSFRNRDLKMALRRLHRRAV